MISPTIDMIMNTVLTILLVGAIGVFLKKVKDEKVKSFKGALPSICLFLAAIVNLIALWFDLLGIISTFLTLGLILTGGYFTKYIPSASN